MGCDVVPIIYTYMILFVLVGPTMADTSLLYTTSNEKAFQDWHIAHYYEDETVQYLSHINNTQQINVSGINNLRAKNRSRLVQTRVTSPFISISPAYEITYKVQFLVNGKELKTIEPNIRAHSTATITNKTSSWNGATVIISGDEIVVKTERRSGIRDKFFRWQFVIIWPSNSVAKNFQIKSVNLTSFEVTYQNCPATVNNLTYYKNSVATREKHNPIRSFGICVENAEKVRSRSNRPLIRFCDTEGESSFVEECLCKAGYETEQNFKRCKKCQNGYFQPYQSKRRCQKCGQKSEDVNNVRCRCQENTFRYQEHRHDNMADCFEYPSHPMFPESSKTTNSSMTIEWKLPKYIGSFRDIFYTVKCLRPKPTCDLRNTTNQKRKILKLSTMLDDLLAFTLYTFQLCAHNNVSESNNYAQTGKNCMEFNAKTHPGYPTEVRNFHVADMNRDKGIVSFGWSTPLSMGNIDLRYFLQCPGKNATKFSTGNQQEFTTVEIAPRNNEIACYITPVTTDTTNQLIHGPTQVVTFQFHSRDVLTSDTNTAEFHTIIGSSTGAVAVFFLLLFISIKCASTNRKQKHSLMDLAKQLQRERLELESIARASRSFRTNQKNIYVPLNLLLNQPPTPPTLQGDGPVYEEVPIGYEYDYKHLNFKQILGEGNFAIVYQAEVTNICGYAGTSFVAVKELKDQCKKADKEDFEGELDLMMGLEHHQNLVKLLGICSKPRKSMIVEYMPGGDLLTYLLKSRQYPLTTKGSFFTAQDLLTFAYHITRGMEHLAKSNIVHRDLACRNVLVGYNRTCKIADLGLARRLNDEGVYIRFKQEKLPIKWLPIETIKYRRSTLQSDIWSYGITLWEIVTIGGVPYPDHKSKEIPDLLDKGYRMSKPQACSNELYDMMLECWSDHEQCRPTFFQLAKQLQEMLKDLQEYVHMEVYDNDNSYLEIDGDGDVSDDEVFIDESQLNDDANPTISCRDNNAI